MMLTICRWLSGNLNAVIFILALFEACITIKASVKLISLRKRFTNLTKGNKRRKGPPRKTGKGKVSSTFETLSTKDWAKLVDFRRDYQKGLVPYHIFALLIQIFPLLGILGTVAGLYISMSERQDLYRGVEFALSSTVLGIICAVIFKVFDIIIVALLINYIDDGIDAYEKDYNVENEESRTSSYPYEALIESYDGSYEEK